MVTSVLLNVAWMCAWPRGTDLRSRRRCRPTGRLGAFSAMLLPIPPQLTRDRQQRTRATYTHDELLNAPVAALRRLTGLLLRRLLLAGDGLLGAALGAGVGAGALAMHR